MEIFLNDRTKDPKYDRKMGKRHGQKIYKKDAELTLNNLRCYLTSVKRNSN